MFLQSLRVENQVHKFGERVLEILGRQEWLDRPSYRFEHVLTFVYNALGGARNRVTNILHGVWLGHPVHPPLASLSTGSIATTVVLDVVSSLPGQSGSERGEASRFARHALGFGILANVGAAVTGMTDWQHTQEKDRRVGVVHGLLNLFAIGLYARSWADRVRGRRLRGIAGTAAGYGITMASSYLGGAMVFGSGVGIDQAGKRLELDEWTPVLPAASLEEGKPQRVGVGADGVGLVLYRNGDSVSAVGEFCPHLAAPMADGWLDRGRIVCPWHGSWFDAQSGEVLRGPSAAALPCYQTRLRDGMIELRAGTSDGARAVKGVVAQ